jgi:hypothetical protein
MTDTIKKDVNPDFISDFLSSSIKNARVSLAYAFAQRSRTTINFNLADTRTKLPSPLFGAESRLRIGTAVYKLPLAFSFQDELRVHIVRSG